MIDDRRKQLNTLVDIIVANQKRISQATESYCGNPRKVQILTKLQSASIETPVEFVGRVHLFCQNRVNY